MNYRHAFHAGNFADVFKHAILARILSYLIQKPAPLMYLDTHAGAVLYDLASDAAQRSPEWRDGISRLIAHGVPEPVSDLLKPYLHVAQEGLSGETLLSYPGSPVFAQRLLREQDRLILCELHPEDARIARENLGRDPRARVQEGDGYLALNAVLPPPERRGLVLIDPPFEQPSEWDDMAEGVNKALKKWPTGCYALWYPIKSGVEGRDLAARLDKDKIKSLLCLEVFIAAPDKPGKHDRKGLSGCGLLVINPPFVLAEEAEILLPALSDLLAQGEPGWRADWLKQA